MAKTHICSNCFQELYLNQTFVASIPSKDYSTMFCKPCIDKLKLEGKPLQKPKKYEFASKACSQNGYKYLSKGSL